MGKDNNYININDDIISKDNLEEKQILFEEEFEEKNNNIEIKDKFKKSDIYKEEDIDDMIIIFDDDEDSNKKVEELDKKTIKELNFDIDSLFSNIITKKR